MTFPVTAPSQIPIGSIDQFGRVWDGIRWRCPVGIPEAPTDGRIYGREDQTWQPVVAASGGEITSLTVDSSLSVLGPLSATTATIGTLQVGKITGVTDGSNAAMGAVGEYIEATGSMPYPAYPGSATVSIPVVILQPGDWDCHASLQPTSAVGGANFQLSPQPAGLSTTMIGIFGGEVVGGGGFVDTVVVIGQSARANLTVATQLTFSVEVINATDASLTAGTAYLLFQARRMR